MNVRLLRSCAALWFTGLLGMYVVRALLALGPGALSFRVAAAFWIVGGLGYTGFGVLALAAGVRVLSRDERR